MASTGIEGDIASSAEAKAPILYLFLGLYLVPFVPLFIASLNLSHSTHYISSIVSLVGAFMNGPIYLIGPLLAPLFAVLALKRPGTARRKRRIEYYVTLAVLCGTFLGALAIATSLKTYAAVWLAYAGEDGLEPVRDLAHLYLSQSITNMALVSGIRFLALGEPGN